MLKKVYFPRLIIPISNVISGTVDFLFAFIVLVAMMLYYGIPPTANVVWLPFHAAFGDGHVVEVGGR